MTSSNSPATKADVEDAIREITPGIVTEIVTKVVGDAKTEILSAVGDQLTTMNDDIDKRFDYVEATVNRIEGKLDVTADKVDGHEVRIEKLEHKAA